MIVKIDKDIPLPGDVHFRLRNNKYPWAEMEVGDSFVFENVKRGSVATMVSLRNKYDAPKQFVVRIVDGVMRCWRTQ